MLVFLTGITALAALNATLLPLYLEGQAARADGTQAMVFIGRRTDWLAPTIGDLQKGVELNVTDTERLLLHEARERYMAYGESGCPLRDPYVRNVLKHTVELQRMQVCPPSPVCACFCRMWIALDSLEMKSEGGARLLERRSSPRVPQTSR